MQSSQITAKQGNFFGRRCGKSLSQLQKELLEILLPQRKIQLSSLTSVEQIYRLFPNTMQLKELHLEIGFGGGEHLLHHAAQRPQTGFIGVEPFVNSMVKMLKAIQQNQPLYENILLYDEDACKLLSTLPDNSLSGIDLFYPDPWPKLRHHKRRFVNAENLKQMVRILQPGGYFRFASDIDNYVEWTLLLAQDNGALEWQANAKSDWQTPYSNWTSTRYEQKALKAGRVPSYLTFQNIKS